MSVLRKIADRLRLSPVQVTFAFAGLVGLAAGLGAYGFNYLIHLVEGLCGLDTPGQAGGLGLRIIFLPALGGLLAGPLIYFFAREAKGGGVTEVIYSVLKRGGRIRPIVAVIKTAASALTLGSGGSAGSEGPIVQIGAAFGSTLGQIFRMPPRRIKTLLACGSAGGIAAIFNAPFAGIMFSLEVILHEFRSLSFIYVAISAVIASLVSRALSGNQPIFQVPHVLALNSAFEIFLFLGLGAGMAFIAKLFLTALELAENSYQKLRFPEYLKASTGGLAVGLLAFLFTPLIPHPTLSSPLSVLGVGYHGIELVIARDFYLAQAAAPLAISLALVVLLKVAATALTLGSGGSGGIFAPSLFLGAMAGGLYGIAAEALFGATSGPACYALVGMGACFAGIVQAPITTIFIIFEITNSYEVILPIIAASVASSLVTHWLNPVNHYAANLKKRGVNLQSRRKPDLLESILIREVMLRDVQTILSDTKLGELKSRLGRTLHTSLPVVDPAGRLLGTLAYKQMHQAFLSPDFNPQADAAGIMVPDPAVAYPHEQVSAVFRRMKLAEQGFAPVLASETDRRVVGLVTYSNIFSAYEKAILD